MPKKKTKAVKNGYFYFMQDVREREALKGRRFPSQKEVADFCAPLWAKLLPQEKEEYSALAKRKRLEEKNAIDEAATKMNSLGISIAHQDAEIREQEENELIMKTHINNLMNHCGKAGIMTQTFYLCHVNYGFKVGDKRFAPVELALAEFSLHEGITNRFHTFLQPGEIPLGLRYEAIEWSNTTHKIPISGTLGEKLDKKIFDHIVSFLNSKGKNKSLPVIYTMPDSTNSNDSTKAVVSAFKQLCNLAEKDPEIFRIYQLPYLLYALRNKSVEGGEKEYEFPSVALATGFLQNNISGSYSNMGCSFHVENDCELKCSLAAVTRWAYVVCDFCCQYLGIEVIPGKHIPVRQSRYSAETGKVDLPVLPCVSPEEVTLLTYAALSDPEEVAETLPSSSSYSEDSYGYQYQEDEFPDLGGNSRNVRKEYEKPATRAWGNPWRK